MKLRRFAICVMAPVATVLGIGCLPWQALADESRTVLPAIPLGLIEPDIPSNRPLTKDKVGLGEKLFTDPRLSSTGRVSCATCHVAARAFSEGRTVSVNADGVQLRRNAPTLFNAGFLTTVGWDGKWRTLEEQIDDVFSKRGDMAVDVGEVLSRIDGLSDYNGLFEKAFGRKVDREGLGEALASYQRSLLSGDTRFDRFLFGNQQQALSGSERHGYELFLGKASCINCHDVFHPSINPLGGAMALFSDSRFHNLGIGYKNGKMQDVGRYNVTRDKADWGAFKTPTLRNVVLTAPYMHDGSLKSLREVVEFYNRGGNRNPQLAPSLKPLFLTDDEMDDLIAFFDSLTDPRYDSKARLR